MTPEHEQFLALIQEQQKKRGMPGGVGPGTAYGGTGVLQENLMTVPPDSGPLNMTALHGRSDMGIAKSPAYVENRGEVEANPSNYSPRSRAELARLLGIEKAEEERAPKALAANIAARDKSYREEGGMSPEQIAALPQPGVPPDAPPIAPPAASNQELPPGSNVPADDPKGQFLRAIALKGQATGGDTRRRDFAQLLQSADENLQLPPSLISAWSPQGMHFLESSGGGPSKTRQKEIDEINLSDRESASNAAQIEAARVKNESAAKELRDLTPDQVAQISKLEDSDAEVESVLKDLPSNAGAVGPVDSRVGKVMEWFGADGQGAEFRRRIQSAMNNAIQALSGAGVPLKEVPRIEAGYFSDKDTEENLKLKAESKLAEIRAVRARHMENMKNARYDVGRFNQGSSVVGDGEMKVGGMYKGRKIIAVDPNNPKRVQVE